MSNRKLKELFGEYNRKYFNSRLPNDTIVEWSAKMPNHALERVHIHGMTKCSECGCCRSFIRLHPDLKRMESVALMTMLHAMVHLDGHMDGEDDHGPKFQKEMKRLAAKGAFKYLW